MKATVRMPRCPKVPRWALLITLVALLSAGVGIAAWSNRGTLIAWYALRGLAHSGPADRLLWIAMIHRLDRSVLGRLVEGLAAREPQVCGNLREALASLMDEWPAEDSRRPELARRLAESFPRLSKQGQRTALEIHALLLEPVPDLSRNEELSASTAELLSKAAATSDVVVHSLALATVGKLEKQVDTLPDLLSSCRRLLGACLADKQQASVVSALRLAMKRGINLADAVVPLLHDPDPEVRRSAMLAVGTSEAAISTDDLLHWLHDSDREVRQLCEAALRSRGLQDEHLRLGRIMSDSRPGTRLQVFELLREADDLEPGVWLRRLSHDPSPAVRAAAIRATFDLSVTNLADRLQQMAQNDPCPTVRQLAQYYSSLSR
jgi:hypothetical protein